MSRNVEALVAAGVKKKENHSEPLTRGAVSDKIYLWTNGRVPYIIDSDFGKHEELSRTWTGACLVRAFPGGTSLYWSYRYTVCAAPKAMFFLAVLVINRASILAILVSSRVWFLHFSLELCDMFNLLEEAKFLIIIDTAINKITLQYFNNSLNKGTNYKADLK